MIPRVVVITDWALGEARLFDQLAAALSSGVPLAIQHRNPGVTTAVYFAQAEKLRARLPCPLFVSARLDVAIALDAHLHLPAWAVTPADARPKLGTKWLSVAVHDETEAKRAAGADFALVSPLFSKAAIGRDGFARLAAALPCPAYALGGVTGPVPGASGVAVISHVLGAADPAAAVRALVAR